MPAVRTAIEDGSVHHRGEENRRAEEDVQRQEVNAVDSEEPWLSARTPKRGDWRDQP